MATALPSLESFLPDLPEDSSRTLEPRLDVQHVLARGQELLGEQVARACWAGGDRGGQL